MFFIFHVGFVFTESTQNLSDSPQSRQLQNNCSTGNLLAIENAKQTNDECTNDDSINNNSPSQFVPKVSHSNSVIEQTSPFRRIQSNVASHLNSGDSSNFPSRLNSGEQLSIEPGQNPASFDNCQNPANYDLDQNNSRLQRSFDSAPRPALDDGKRHGDSKPRKSSSTNFVAGKSVAHWSSNSYSGGFPAASSPSVKLRYVLKFLICTSSISLFRL